VNNVRLSFYYQHMLGQIPPVPISDRYRVETQHVIDRFIRPLDLSSNSAVQDLASGPGYFLDRMHELGYNNLQGVEQSAQHVNDLRARGHKIRHGHGFLLPDADESQDLLFSRDIMISNPSVSISLLEYNRVLRSRAWLYIEVPAPDQDPLQENLRSSVSVMGRNQWLSLLQCAGFDIQWHQVQWPGSEENQKDRTSFVFLCQRRRPVDVK